MFKIGFTPNENNRSCVYNCLIDNLNTYNTLQESTGVKQDTWSMGSAQ